MFMKFASVSWFMPVARTDASAFVPTYTSRGS